MRAQNSISLRQGRLIRAILPSGQLARESETVPQRRKQPLHRATKREDDVPFLCRELMQFVASRTVYIPWPGAVIAGTAAVDVLERKDVNNLGHWVVICWLTVEGLRLRPAGFLGWRRVSLETEICCWGLGVCCSYIAGSNGPRCVLSPCRATVRG